MSDTATWTNENAGTDVDEKTSTAWRALIALALTLGLGFAASLLVYFKATRSVYLLGAQAGAGAASQPAQLNSLLAQQFDRWALWVALGTEAGCAVFVVSVLAAVIWWRRGWQDRLRQMDQASRGTVAALERKLAESLGNRALLQISKAETEQRVTSLEAANSQLQAELDKLRKAEKSLAHERQTLESSKAVLEVHVQARTKELQKLQRRYELILNSAGEGICGLDAEGRTTFANPAAAKLTGWPLEELIGSTEEEVFGHNGADGEAAHD